MNAAFFHLYGITRDDAAYILDTFPIVKLRDEDKTGQLSGHRKEHTCLVVIESTRDNRRCSPHTGAAFLASIEDDRQ